MILIILMVVGVYSSLMVWILAKLGSTPAKSVLEMFKGNFSRSQAHKRKTYEQTISAR